MIHDDNNNNTSDDPLMALQLAFHGEVQDHHAEDNHQDDLLMPGFRFHPTDEELIDFYLRRKLEGKSFIIDFIPFINLYSYDPWDLPGIYLSINLSLSLYIYISSCMYMINIL